MGWGLSRGGRCTSSHRVTFACNEDHRALAEAHGVAFRSSTTAAGLRAGRPTQVVSFFGDQPSWGRRVAALGAGPPPIHRTKLTADRLASGITRLLEDDSYAGRAASVAKAIASERGAERAAETILA